MSVTGEFQRYLQELIERLRAEAGSDPRGLAAQLEAVAADSRATLAARAERVLEALGESSGAGAADLHQDDEARASLSRICRIVLGQ